MDAIPDVSGRIARRAVGSWQDEGGRVTLRRRRAGPVRTAVLRLFRVPPDVTLRLDDVGSEAWRLMDGRRTVHEIRVELERVHPGLGDVGRRLGRLLGVLVSKGFVRLE